MDTIGGTKWMEVLDETAPAGISITQVGNTCCGVGIGAKPIWAKEVLVVDKLPIASNVIVNNNKQKVNFLQKIVFENISVKYANNSDDYKDFG